MKLRAASLNISTVTNVIENFSKKKSDTQIAINSLNQYLLKMRDERTENDLNAELQLVMKMGRIEDEPLRGKLDQDLRHAIVVPKRDIDRVNEAIVISGKKKIRSIERQLEFRRAMKLEEWEHRCLKVKIIHQNVMLYYVRMAHVTREIKEYLKRKNKGHADDKMLQRLHRDVDKKRGNLEKVGNFENKYVC